MFVVSRTRIKSLTKKEKRQMLAMENRGKNKIKNR
jgi:hypothetical protein